MGNEERKNKPVIDEVVDRGAITGLDGSLGVGGGKYRAPYGF